MLYFIGYIITHYYIYLVNVRFNPKNKQQILFFMFYTLSVFMSTNLYPII